MKKLTVFVLIASLLLCTFVPAFAAGDERYVINDKEKKAAYMLDFNNSVNAVKTQMPTCTLITSNTLEDPSLGSEDGELLDENAQKWIKWIVDSCFKDGAGLANTLFSTIFSDTSAPKTVSFLAGEKRDNRVPVCGTPYVSALTADDNFTLTVQTTGGTALHPENAVTYTSLFFPDVALEDVDDSSLSKVFNLTDASLNPVIVSDAAQAYTTSGKDVLDDVKLDGFEFRNATVQSFTDGDGRLTAYTTDIDYCFSLSLYDFIRLISVIIKIDFMSTVTGIANVILENNGKGTLTPSEILQTRHLYITYHVHNELSGFSWDRRSFGDVDGDGKVSISDARIALRHAIDIQPIKNGTTLIYTDMDFDGDVTVSDARLILRSAIGLEELFSYVPEGKQITIVEVADPNTGSDDIPVLPEPDEVDEDDTGTTSGMIDASETIAEIIQSVYDIVYELEDAELYSVGVIDDLIEFFQHLKDD